MSGQRRFLKVWARTVGMPIGVDDDDKPEFCPSLKPMLKKRWRFEPFGLHYMW